MKGRYDSFGLLAVTIAALSAIRPTSSEIIQYVLLFIALLSLFSFLYVFHGYPCKEKLISAWGICKRCIGFYLGGSFSVILLIMLKLSDNIPIFSRPVAVLLLVIGGVACSLPVMISGGKRRLQPNQGSENSGFLFFSGFAAGLGWILCYLALNTLLKR